MMRTSRSPEMCPIHGHSELYINTDMQRVKIALDALNWNQITNTDSASSADTVAQFSSVEPAPEIQTRVAPSNDVSNQASR